MIERNRWLEQNWDKLGDWIGSTFYILSLILLISWFFSTPMADGLFAIYGMGD